MIVRSERLCVYLWSLTCEQAHGTGLGLWWCTEQLMDLEHMDKDVHMLLLVRITVGFAFFECMHESQKRALLAIVNLQA